MTRLCASISFAFASVVTLFVASHLSMSSSLGTEVSVAEAAGIRGGQCGSYAQSADGACTNEGSDSCTQDSTDCDGACPYACTPQMTYSGSGTFTGSLIGSSCDPVSQQSCTQTICTLGGLPVSCCECLGGKNIACGPAPSALDPDGCSS